MSQRYLNFIFILLLSISFLALSLYRIGKDFPPGMNHDAAWNGLYAIRILNGDPSTRTPYAPEAYGRETLFHYTLALFFKLFGIKKETIEATAVFFGLLSVPLFYSVLLSLSKRKHLSFLLSFFWISSSALIIYSRAGWRLVTLIPATLLLMLFVSFYQSKKGLINALAIGFSSALVLYTYNGGLLVVFFFFLFWSISLFQNKFKRGVLLDFLNSSLFFTLVSLPMALFAVNNWVLFFGRATTLSGKLTFNQLVENFKAVALFFNVRGGGGDFITNFPALEGPVSLLWALGLFFAFYQFKKYWPYLLLFFLFWLPAALTLPSFHRAVGTLPLVYLFASIPFFYINKAIKKGWVKKAFFATTFLVVFVQIVLSLSKLYLEKKPFLSGFYPEATIVGQYLKEHNFNYDKTVLYAGNWPKDILTFLSLKDPGSYVKDQEIKNNYAPYNTESKDGLPEIIEDLKKGDIDIGSTFVVDFDKNDNFLSSMKENQFDVEKKGEIKNKKGEPVAFLYQLQKSSN